MFAGFLDGKAAKGMQLDQFGSPGISVGKPIEDFIERQQPVRFLLLRVCVIQQINALPLAATLGTFLPTGAINEDSPHGQRRHGQEVGSPVPLRIHLISNKTNKRLVHQSRRLQGLTGLFLVEITGRKAAQFVVHQRKQSLGGERFAPADGVQKLRDFIHGERRRAGSVSVGCRDVNDIIPLSGASLSNFHAIGWC